MDMRPSRALTTALPATGRIWINRMGQPVPRPEIRRIICLKLDHIGDLLVADAGFRLLRQYFPLAHITLLCGKWNMQLATRLGIADRVIGVNLFHAQGAEQHNEKIAAQARKRGLEEIAALQLGEFDLAIDMRIDEDTRDLLKLFPAKAYAGSGNLSRFPYLDISLPVPDGNLNLGRQAFRLAPKDFATGGGFQIGSFGIEFTRPIMSCELKFSITGAKAPKDCGTSADDDRLLGIGLKEITILAAHRQNGEVTQRFIGKRVFALGSRDVASLSSGWALPEIWGTWSNAAEATMHLLIDEDLEGAEQILLQISFRAHVNPANPSIELAVSDRLSGLAAALSCSFPDAENTLELALPVQGIWGAAKSRSFTVKAGEYVIELEAYRRNPACEHGLYLKVNGTSPERVMLYEEFRFGATDPARTRSRCAIEIEDNAEPIQIEVGPSPENQDTGIFVVSVAGAAKFVRPAKLPSAHMERRIAQLVLATALELSPSFDAIESRAETFLTTITQPDLAPLDQEEVQKCFALRREEGKLLIGLGLGATKETKRWPFSYILEFCQLLLSRPNVILVFCGGPAEVDETARMQRALAMDDRVVNVCGVLPLQALGTLIGIFDLYIGYDTGTTHYAGKTGVRTVGIFSAVHNPREWGPVGRRASTITYYTDCSPCYLPKLDDCLYGHACMLDMTPAECWTIMDGVISQIVHETTGAEDPFVPVQPAEQLEHLPECAIKFGERYTVGIDREFNEALIDGWYSPEDFGRWCGRSARFAALLDRADGEPVALFVSGRVFGTDANGPISVRVLQDGVERACWVFTNDDHRWQSAILVPSRRGGAWIVECSFDCAEGTSPFATGESDDRRYLGLWLEKYEIRTPVTADASHAA